MSAAAALLARRRLLQLVNVAVLIALGAVGYRLAIAPPPAPLQPLPPVVGPTIASSSTLALGPIARPRLDTVPVAAPKPKTRPTKPAPKPKQVVRSSEVARFALIATSVDSRGKGSLCIYQLKGQAGQKLARLGEKVSLGKGRPELEIAEIHREHVVIVAGGKRHEIKTAAALAREAAKRQAAASSASRAR